MPAVITGMVHMVRTRTVPASLYFAYVAMGRRASWPHGVTHFTVSGILIARHYLWSDADMTQNAFSVCRHSTVIVGI